MLPEQHIQSGLWRTGWEGPSDIRIQTSLTGDPLYLQNGIPLLLPVLTLGSLAGTLGCHAVSQGQLVTLGKDFCVLCFRFLTCKQGMA